MNFNLVNEGPIYKACGPIKLELEEYNDVLLDLDKYDYYLTNYEIDILMLFISEINFTGFELLELGFQGIKQKLNIHQQKLSIAIKRLINKNLIIKTSDGYRLTEKGYRLINNLLQNNIIQKNIKSDFIGIEAKISLKINYNINEFINKLKKRWFSHWRWVGIFYGNGIIKMEWQSLEKELEACLCFDDKCLHIAIFDKNINSTKSNLEYLEKELDYFIEKIIDILDLHIINDDFYSKYIVSTDCNCNKKRINNWISNFT